MTTSRTPSILAIIPARAGSRGVPGKNFRPLMGKPVIRYTIDDAQAAQTVDRIVITSDAPEALDMAGQCGIDFIQRPEALAGDQARVDDALRHCCAELTARDGYEPLAVVMLYANVPIRAAGTIDRCVKLLLDSGADSVQTLCDVGKYHPYWLQTLDDAGGMTKYIDNTIYRRQELPPVYALSSAATVIRYDVLMAAAGSSDPHAFFGSDRRGVVQDSHDTVDIDAPLDMFVAQAILQQRQTEGAKRILQKG